MADSIVAPGGTTSCSTTSVASPGPLFSIVTWSSTASLPNAAGATVSLCARPRSAGSEGSRPRRGAHDRLRGQRRQLLAERGRDERRLGSVSDLLLGGQVVVDADLEADLGGVAWRAGDRDRASSPRRGAAPEEEPHRALRGVVLALVVPDEVGGAGRARGRARDSQRPGHVRCVGRDLVGGHEVRRRLETLVGERDRVAQPVARAGRTAGVRQVRDGLGRAYHRRVEVGGERDHVRQILIAAGLQPDRRAGGAVGEQPVDPDHLRVESQLVDVVGRLVSEVLAVDRDRAVEEVVRRVHLVAQGLAVQGRAVPGQARGRPRRRRTRASSELVR